MLSNLHSGLPEQDPLPPLKLSSTEMSTSFNEQLSLANYITNI